MTAPGGYRFPAGVSVDIGPAMQTGVTDRAILAGYSGYVLDLWAAAASHGTDRAYQHQASGSALSLIRQEIAYFSSGNRELQGTITYSGVAVAAIYYNTTASVSACVDTSAFRVADAKTGADTGQVFPGSYASYLESVTETEVTGGAWQVTSTAAYPAATSEGAACQ